jgi:hypothetical protein
MAAEVLGGAATLATPAPSDRRVERVLTPSDLRHPIFQAFGARAGALSLVKFRRVASLDGPACQTLARFNSGEPALLECMAGEGRVLALASDLGNAWNDFPLHASFVPFVHESIRYLAGPRLQTLEFSPGTVPPGAVAEPGFAVLSPDSPAPRRVAVNVDPSESDPARLSADEFRAAVTRLDNPAAAAAESTAARQEERQRLWQYLLGLMVAMLVAESVLGSGAGFKVPGDGFAAATSRFWRRIR